MSEYSPGPKILGGEVKVELHWFNYATKQIYKMEQELIHQNLLKQLV